MLIPTIIKLITLNNELVVPYSAINDIRIITFTILSLNVDTIEIYISNGNAQFLNDIYEFMTIGRIKRKIHMGDRYRYMTIALNLSYGKFVDYLLSTS